MYLFELKFCQDIYTGMVLLDDMAHELINIEAR